MTLSIIQGSAQLTHTHTIAVHAKVPCLMLADHYKPQNAKQICAEGSIQTHEPYIVYQEGSLVQHLNKYIEYYKNNVAQYIYSRNCCPLDTLTALTGSVPLTTALLTVVGSGLAVCDTASSGSLSKSSNLCCSALGHIFFDEG